MIQGVTLSLHGGEADGVPGGENKQGLGPVGSHFAAGPALANPLDKLPLTFEENRGQADATIRFLARGPGYNLYFKDDEVTLVSDSIADPDRSRRSTSAKLSNGQRSVTLRFLGQNRTHPVADTLAPGVSNYFVGNSPGRWHTAIPHFQNVRYRNIYPGVDVVFHGDPRQLEYDLLVAPGVDPRQIRLQVMGGTKPFLSSSGDIVASLSGVVINHLKA